MLYFLEDPVCGIEGLEDIVHFAVVAVRVIQIVVPIALIIWGSLDLLKAVIANDDKKVKEMRRPFIQRLISAVLVFLVPFIVDKTITAFADTSSNSTSWANCYAEAAKK